MVEMRMGAQYPTQAVTTAARSLSPCNAISDPGLSNRQRMGANDVGIGAGPVIMPGIRRGNALTSVESCATSPALSVSQFPIVPAGLVLSCPHSRDHRQQMRAVLPDQRQHRPMRAVRAWPDQGVHRGVGGESSSVRDVGRRMLNSPLRVTIERVGRTHPRRGCMVPGCRAAVLRGRRNGDKKRVS